MICDPPHGRPHSEPSAHVQRLSSPSRPWRRSRKFWAAIIVGGPIAIIGLASWLFTADLEKHGPAEDETQASASDETDPRSPTGEAEQSSVVWPQSPVDGDEAKRILLDALIEAERRLDRIPAYSGRFIRQERIRGKLSGRQNLEIKVRHHPFAVYLKFLEPEAGKEIIYAQGHYDNNLIAHAGGISRRLFPRLTVKPDSPLAMADNRHPITDAGLANLTRRLIRFRKMDLSDPDAVTILDRTVDESGQPLLHSVHRHTIPNPERPFAYVEVWYQPDTFYPIRIRAHGWPEDGSSPKRDEDCPLLESYSYEEIDWNAPVAAIDFDPANPKYEFRRF